MKNYLYQRLNLSTSNIYWFLSALIFISLINACNPKPKVESQQTIEEIKIVPAPVKILYKRNYFTLDKSTRVLLNLSDEKSKIAGDFLIKSILNKTGYQLKIADRFTTIKIPSTIEIIIGGNNNIKTDGYNINVSGNRIKLIANDSNGLLYASNTILRLITKINGDWKTAQVSIEDYPRTNFRGIYLTISDSTLDKERVVDMLKISKINYLVTSGNWEEYQSSLLRIDDTSQLYSNWANSFVEGQSIKDYYKSVNLSEQKSLFRISDTALLHPDSIQILGEAMWSSPKKLNYQKLLNHLESKPTH